MTPTSAAGAYSAIAQLANQTRTVSNAGGEAGGGIGDFGSMLREAVSSVAEKGRVAEASQVAMAEGKGDVVNLVTAMADTEVAVQTLVAVRDRVIAAYEEIMRMPM